MAPGNLRFCGTSPFNSETQYANQLIRRITMALLKVTIDTKSAPKPVPVESLEPGVVFYLDSASQNDAFMRLDCRISDDFIPVLRFHDADIHRVGGARKAYPVESAQLLIIP
jgi:hypothetical protein